MAICLREAPAGTEILGGGGGGGGPYLTLYCHHQNDFYIKMGSDDSHFVLHPDSQ